MSESNWAEGSGSNWEDLDGDPRITEGAEVLVGRHRGVEGDDNWGFGMAQFVGTRQIVSWCHAARDLAGCRTVLLRKAPAYWRARDLVCLRAADGLLTEEGEMLQLLGKKGAVGATVVPGQTATSIMLNEAEPALPWALRVGVLHRSPFRQFPNLYEVDQEKLAQVLGRPLEEPSKHAPGTRHTVFGVDQDGNPRQEELVLPEPDDEAVRVHAVKVISIPEGDDVERRVCGVPVPASAKMARVQRGEDGKDVVTFYGDSNQKIYTVALRQLVAAQALHSSEFAAVSITGSLKSEPAPAETVPEGTRVRYMGKEVVVEHPGLWRGKVGWNGTLRLSSDALLNIHEATMVEVTRTGEHAPKEGGVFISGVGPQSVHGVRVYDRELTPEEVNAVYQWDANLLPKLKAYFDAGLLTGMPDPRDVLASLLRCLLAGTTDMVRRTSLEGMITGLEGTSRTLRPGERAGADAQDWTLYLETFTFEPSSKVCDVARAELARLAGPALRRVPEDTSGEELLRDFEGWLRKPCRSGR